MLHVCHICIRYAFMYLIMYVTTQIYMYIHVYMAIPIAVLESIDIYNKKYGVRVYVDVRVRGNVIYICYMCAMYVFGMHLCT